ncbi:MAG: RedB protein [Myxococcales bacterium]|nr:RedB protein [Myxococcales bacterium]
MRAERLTWLVPVVAGAWVIGLAIGARAVYHYATEPGSSGATPEIWPSSSSLTPPPHGTTAVVFVHPECPCSRATLHELVEVTRDLRPAAARVLVVFEGRGDGDLWQDAGRTPRLERVLDEAGEGARFGAQTSGFAVVYDASAHLVFHGGITGSRGHVGTNIGSVELRAALDGTPSGEHPVFGCALAEETP